MMWIQIRPGYKLFAKVIKQTTKVAANKERIKVRAIGVNVRPEHYYQLSESLTGSSP